MRETIKIKKLYNMKFFLKQLLNYSIFLMLIFYANSCQIPFEAEIEGKIGLISIDGSIVKGDSLQTITISSSTSLYIPEFDPVIGCAVSIIDELGNEFLFPETEDGTYTRAIPDEFLVYDRMYRLKITTPDGDQYESDYETIRQGAPVDSIYYERDNMYVASEDEELYFVQFYLDLKGSESDSRYYRWGLTEAWEYVSISYIDYIYVDEELNIEYPESPIEFYRCWNSRKVPGFYSSSTVNLTSNLKKKIPLHQVSTVTGRLSIKYSLLVEQYSLNEGAYNYWNQAKTETEEAGGLYTQQPGQTQTNLFNVNDSKEEVLGYFWASSKTEKRIFTSRPRDLTINPYCQLYSFLLEDHGEGPFPRYIVIKMDADDDPIEFTSSPECLNCTLLGGVNKKPNYWE